MNEYLRPLVCLVDRKSRIWPAPVMYQSEEFAKRELLHAVKYGKGIDGNPPIFVDYPQDFDLAVVARFNIATGEVVPLKTPELIGCVSDIIGAKE